MSRRPADLTLEDLRVLSDFLIKRPRSIAAAAEELKVERALLMRILERLDRHFSYKLPWRLEGRLVPPAEVRRLVAAYRTFAAEFHSLSGPRVSAGPSAALLFGQVVALLKESVPRLLIVRSRDVLNALLEDRIDVAVLHASSVSRWSLDLQSGGVLTSTPLLNWRAVRVRLRTSRQRRDRVRLDWEPESTGERLEIAHGSRAADAVRWPCPSFIQALEFLRRGVVTEIVIPDIYVPASDASLLKEPLTSPTQDFLVAMCRREDESRWKVLLQQPVWEKAAKGNM